MTINKSLNLKDRKAWLITGVAGFIGSNILEYLLSNNQRVIGLDNFVTGKSENLHLVKNNVGLKAWNNFEFLEGDIVNFNDCLKVTNGADFVLHQAALGSVPRSIKNPINTHDSNATGFLNILHACKENKIKRLVFASSSSVYGDDKTSPKLEDVIGNPLSPYALSKKINEEYARVYSHIFESVSIGLRYFNVFGPRQNPEGEYAAVIPKWIDAVLNNKTIIINGDGSTSRDFTYVENVVFANVLSAISMTNHKYMSLNIACNSSISLNYLLSRIIQLLKVKGYDYEGNIENADFRKGDIKNSQAEISKAIKEINYIPLVNFDEGLENTIEYFLSR